MYVAEKHFAVLENVAGFARLDAYVYCPVTKWRHWGMFIHWETNFAFPERCTSRNATGARFLEVQIPTRVLVYDWAP